MQLITHAPFIWFQYHHHHHHLHWKIHHHQSSAIKRSHEINPKPTAPQTRDIVCNFLPLSLKANPLLGEPWSVWGCRRADGFPSYALHNGGHSVQISISTIQNKPWPLVRYKPMFLMASSSIDPYWTNQSNVKSVIGMCNREI